MSKSPVTKDESVLLLPSGLRVVFESATTNPCGTSYVRFVDPDDREVSYWDSAEWSESPEQAIEVMGAIMGGMKSALNALPK
jgi:hypothetical protein